MSSLPRQEFGWPIVVGGLIHSSDLNLLNPFTKNIFSRIRSVNLSGSQWRQANALLRVLNHGIIHSTGSSER